MHENILESLGLSKNEAKIYESLVTFGGSGVSTIAVRAKVHRRNAYDSLQRLIDKGLVYEVFGGSDVVYEAVAPSKLMEFIKEKEERLNQVLPDLLKQFTSHAVPQKAYIYKGVEGVKNYLKEALQSGEDMYSFAAKGAWFDPRLNSFTSWFLKEAKAKKMGFHHIFDHRVKKEFPELPKQVGKPYAFLPEKFATNSTIDIFGDHVVTYTNLEVKQLGDDLTIFVMVSKELAESYRTWWKLIWELLKVQ